ncbi:hypothetical protein PG985_001960 [Apiospora marii]|uniref:Protein kinase domain-containing protein n=1 Tax=Apiospora marii TaxID=335849 RepID=A0ABR1RY75_9PEZI
MTRPNLKANESEQHPGTAWGKGFISINFEDIEEWEEFTEGNVNKAFFEVLDHAIPQGSHLNAPFGALDRPTTIKMEEDIDQFFLDVIGPIISHSIECTRGLLRDASGNDMALKLCVPFKTEAVKVKLPEEEDGEGECSQGSKRPNFPIYLPAKSMPGMKPRTDVVFVIVHLGKVAMYCKAAGTCLAFTMTTVGATIFRFFTIDNGDGTERWGVQQATFPWCPKWHPLPAENELSAAKAIWASIMMSLDPEARRIQSRDHIRPLCRTKKMLGHGKIYALKMFRFGNNFTPASFFHVKLSQEEEVLYMHPFNCEARAYARMQETNKEHLAIPCHGYILLDQKQQGVLREKDKTCDWAKDWYYRDKYAGQPIQALVKDYIDFDHVGYRETGPDANWRRITRAIDSPKTARTLLNNMSTLHRIGILHRDINSSNVTQGRFLDFSTAWTKPHPCLDTDQIESARDPSDQLGITDACEVDQMIELWNKNHPPKLRLWFRAAQNHEYVERLRSYSKRVKNRNLDLWEWIRSYRGRPDLYDWEGPEDPGAKQRKRDARRHTRSRKKQARQIKKQDPSKA